MRNIIIGAGVIVALAGCTTSSSGTSGTLKQANQQATECDAHHFKRAVDKARCMNDADQVALPVMGNYADLVRYRMAKRIEIAQRLDAGKISRAQANSKIAAVYSQVASEANRRGAQFMAAQSQADAMQSIARSQSRMANAMEDANDLRAIFDQSGS
ncbi:MAG: hypothetical protein BGP07_11520 [Rhizobiales bacterium 63-22]|nr:MAG: hypothetical protein BGP07_11520 [Rhizobiales bacterium 63-22]